MGKTRQTDVATCGNYRRFGIQLVMSADDRMTGYSRLAQRVGSFACGET